MVPELLQAIIAHIEEEQTIDGARSDLHVLHIVRRRKARLSCRRALRDNETQKVIVSSTRKLK